MIYEGLMHLDFQGKPVWGIAKSVNISDDQLTYTFHLRESRWSNADPVTAYDFEYAWKKSIDPQHVKTGAFTFYVIKNVAVCLDNQCNVDEVGVCALDAKTLQVTLEHPAPYFLSLVACSTYSPINKRIDLKYPGWPYKLNRNFVCNGPFKPKKWKKNVSIELEKNTRYWDAQNVEIPQINIYIVPDPNTQVYMFEKGDLDWVGQPYNSLPFDIIQDQGVSDAIEKKEVMGLHWIFLNTEHALLKNKNIRKALAYAINREELTQHVFRLGEKPALGILNSEIALQKKPYFEDGNVEKAREYFDKGLEELGVSREEIKPITLSQRSCIFTLRVSQAIQQQIYNTLGLHVEIEQADFPVHFNKLAKGDYSIGEIGWVSWLRDPIYMLDTFRERSFATNMSRWEHEAYKRYLTLSDHEINPEKRREYLHKAEALLMEEMPVIPLCFSTLSFMKNSKLKNVYISALKAIDFRYAYFEE